MKWACQTNLIKAKPKKKMITYGYYLAKYIIAVLLTFDKEDCFVLFLISDVLHLLL